MSVKFSVKLNIIEIYSLLLNILYRIQIIIFYQRIGHLSDQDLTVD